MKKFILAILCMTGSLTLAACEKNQGVYASNGEDSNEPGHAFNLTGRPAGADHQFQGELISVDMGGKFIELRLENGMVQTLKFDESTSVSGLERQKFANTGRPAPTPIGVRDLVGKEGSELTIDWVDRGGDKVASKIDVTQVSSSKSLRRSKRK